MQNDTDRRRRKRAPILCAALLIVLMAVILAFVLFPLLFASVNIGFALIVLLLYAAAVVAMIIGVAIALRQRLREIDTGEEDAAKRY